MRIWSAVNPPKMLPERVLDVMYIGVSRQFIHGKTQAAFGVQQPIRAARDTTQYDQSTECISTGGVFWGDVGCFQAAFARVFLREQAEMCLASAARGSWRGWMSSCMSVMMFFAGFRLLFENEIFYLKKAAWKCVFRLLLLMIYSDFPVFTTCTETSQLSCLHFTMSVAHGVFTVAGFGGNDQHGVHIVCGVWVYFFAVLPQFGIYMLHAVGEQSTNTR